jgi:hypothetical protein
LPRELPPPIGLSSLAADAFPPRPPRLAGIQQDAIVAAAANELRSSSGSAEGSDCGSGDEKKGSGSGTCGLAGSNHKKGATGGSGDCARREGKDVSATRKLTREAGKVERVKAPPSHAYGGGETQAACGDKRKHDGDGNGDGEGGLREAEGRGGGRGGGEDDDEDDESDQEVELEANGRPKLPRPTVPVSCPRCASEETKFCYYNNYNIKQPRYFCRVRDLAAPLRRACPVINRIKNTFPNSYPLFRDSRPDFAEVFWKIAFLVFPALSFFLVFFCWEKITLYSYRLLCQ